MMRSSNGALRSWIGLLAAHREIGVAWEESLGVETGSDFCIGGPASRAFCHPSNSRAFNSLLATKEMLSSSIGSGKRGGSSCPKSQEEVAGPSNSFSRSSRDKGMVSTLLGVSVERGSVGEARGGCSWGADCPIGRREKSSGDGCRHRAKEGALFFSL